MRADADRLPPPTPVGVEIDAHIALALGGNLDDDGLHENLDARRVEVVDNLLEGLPILRRRADNHRVGRRVGSDIYRIGEIDALAGRAGRRRTAAAGAPLIEPRLRNRRRRRRIRRRRSMPPKPPPPLAPPKLALLAIPPHAAAAAIPPKPPLPIPLAASLKLERPSDPLPVVGESVVGPLPPLSRLLSTWTISSACAFLSR